MDDVERLLWLRRIDQQGTKALNRVKFIDGSVPDDYLVRIPKYNGLRACAILHKDFGPSFILVYGENTRKQIINVALESPSCGDNKLTILDGEWCTNIFFAFDAIFVDGKCTTYYPYFHRQLYMKLFFQRFNDTAICLKTRGQYETDGYIYLVRDGSYYDCIFVKVPNVHTIDLWWPSHSTELYAWCDSTKTLIQIGSSVTLGHSAETNIWSCKILSSSSIETLFEPILPRYDKDRPNSYATALLYLKNHAERGYSRNLQQH